jgi:hypothetical protein
MSTSRCSYGVPTTKLSRMQDVYAFLDEILVKSAKKVEYLEREKLKIEEKITRMCFHMHVLKITTQEEQKTLATLASDLLLQIKAYDFL